MNTPNTQPTLQVGVTSGPHHRGSRRGPLPVHREILRGIASIGPPPDRGTLIAVTGQELDGLLRELHDRDDLDPCGRLELWRLLDHLTVQGASVLLTTQYLEEVDRLADQIVVLDHGEVIAAGSADELKAQVGGDRLELQAPQGADTRPLAAAMAGLGSAAPSVEVEVCRVVVPVADGPGVLPDVAARLAPQGCGSRISRCAAPPLDDVFLTLTGQPATALSTTDTARTSGAADDRHKRTGGASRATTAARTAAPGCCGPRGPLGATRRAGLADAGTGAGGCSGVHAPREDA